VGPLQIELRIKAMQSVLIPDPILATVYDDAHPKE